MLPTFRLFASTLSAAFVLVLVSPSFAASAADAPDAAPEEEPQRDSDDVAITVGIGQGGGLGGFQTADIGFGLEFRLSDYVWLMTRTWVGYGLEAGPGTEHDAWSIFGVVGPRLVFNPSSRVRGSTFLALGVGYAHSAYDDAGVGQGSSEFATAAGVVGLSLDADVAPGIAVGLSTNLARVARTFDTGDSPEAIRIRVTFEPAAHIRFAF